MDVLNELWTSRSDHVCRDDSYKVQRCEMRNAAFSLAAGEKCIRPLSFVLLTVFS